MATNPLPTVLERYPKSFEPLGRGQPYRMLRPGRAALLMFFFIISSLLWLAARTQTASKMNPTPKQQLSCLAHSLISVFVGIDWADA